MSAAIMGLVLDAMSALVMMGGMEPTVMKVILMQIWRDSANSIHTWGIYSKLCMCGVCGMESVNSEIHYRIKISCFKDCCIVDHVMNLSIYLH